MTLDEATTIIHSLGHASKMPCYTYSTSAKSCKRGSKLNRVKGSVCSKCYARKGNFARPTVQLGLNARMDAMSNPKWVEAMVLVLQFKEHSGHFRWFSSGDLQDLTDLIKICEVCRGTPHIKHWLPTHEIGILGEFKRAGFKYPDNLVIRLSADMIDKPVNLTVTRKLGVLAGNVSTTQFNCPSSKQENMCQMCRMCWDKKTEAVTYKFH